MIRVGFEKLSFIERTNLIVIAVMRAFKRIGEDESEENSLIDRF